MERRRSESRSDCSLSSKAYLLIRERILCGHLHPGDVLSTRLLAKEFEMSLLPVSQALRQLEKDKLVESRPRAGTRIRTPTPDEVWGRCIVREALEAQSARLCCALATTKERFELRRLAEQLDTLFDHLGRRNDPDLQFVLNTKHVELHMRIAEYASCPELKEMLETSQVLIYNCFLDIAAKPRSLPPEFHGQLIQVITGFDPVAADEAMRLHVQYGFGDRLKRIVPHTARDWRMRRSIHHRGVGKNGSSSST